MANLPADAKHRSSCSSGIAAAATDDDAEWRRGLMRRPVRCARGPPSNPGEQLVQLMAFGSTGNDALQRVGRVGLRIEIMEFCSVNDRRQDRPALDAAFAAAGQ